MTEKRTILSVPFIQRLLAIGIGLIVLSLLLLIVTGNFAPFMTSELGKLGICDSDDVLQPISSIQSEAETLFICGELLGDTKRYVSFNVYYGSQHIFSWGEGPALKPGEFFIPIRAADLSRPNAGTFPEGKYQLRAAYGRDPIFFVDFEVEATP